MADDRIHGVYIADGEDLIHEHARLGGFPVTRVSEVKAVIGPGISRPRELIG